jgi:asparagine synthetase B (glutamine-hydrolysing)
MLSGEPLRASGEASSRTRDLQRLHGEWDRGRWDALPEARGVFCAVHYQPASSSLTLLTDKLGVRPLFFWIGERYVAFATQLRILEGLSLVPMPLDLRGATEMTTLGYPLGAARRMKTSRCSERRKSCASRRLALGRRRGVGPVRGRASR